MNKLKYPFFVMFFLFSTALFAQTSTNSPFSRFGLGDLSSSYSAGQSSMGGSSVVYSDHMSINSNNPATYSLLRPKSLLLSTSLIFQNTESSTNQLSQTKNNTNIGHISLAMPLNKNLFLSSGLLPYSHVGYMMEETESDPIYGNANYFYQGYGGINNYYLGISAKLHDNISVGINASYLFGGLNRDKDIDFNDESIADIEYKNRTNITGISIKTGLLFNTSYGDDNHISIGVTYQNNSELSVKRSLFGTANSATFVDIFQNDIDTGSLILPSHIAAGISYSNDKWLLIGNYSLQNFSDYEMIFNGTSTHDNFDNSVSISGGLQYTPDDNSVTKYWKRINYRIGARYSKSYLNIIETPLLERSITLGLGIPMKKSSTVYNLSIEIGERGLTDNNLYFIATKTNYKLIKEQFIRVSFGVTFKGIWFVKRKYD